MRRKHTVIKEFKYERGDVVLTFSLHIEKEEEMKAFEECLIEALADVREEMKK